MRMATIDDIRPLALSLPRAYEVLVRDRVKFRVGQYVWLAFSRDETMMGFAFPKEEREALVASEPQKFLDAEAVGHALQLGRRASRPDRRRRKRTRSCSTRGAWSCRRRSPESTSATEALGEQREQRLAVGTWRGERGLSTVRLDLVHEAGPGQHLLGEREAHDRLHHPAEDVGVVAEARRATFCITGFGGGGSSPIAQARPSRRCGRDPLRSGCERTAPHRRSVGSVELARERLRDRRGSCAVASRRRCRVDEPDGDASAGGGVRARPRVTDGARRRSRRAIVDDEPSVSIHDPGHRQHVGDRLTVEPVLSASGRPGRPW